MDKKPLETTIDQVPFRDKHSFLIFILLSVLVSCFVIFVGMTLYNGSGAAQLDLSRPGYVSVRDKATTGDSDYKDYSPNGPMNEDVIDEFKALYDKQAKKVESVNAFSGAPLDAGALGISDQAAASN